MGTSAPASQAIRRADLRQPYQCYLKNLALALNGKFDAHFTALWDGSHCEAGFKQLDFRGACSVLWLWKSMLIAARKSTGRSAG